MSQYVDINSSPVAPASPSATQRTVGRIAVGVTALWGAAVVAAAQSGALASLYRPLIGAIVAATIAAPMLWYALSAELRALVERIGHRRIVMFHVWRIPAALLFFWYGFQGELPAAFWILAGTGDFIAGSYALVLTLRGSEDPASIRGFHRFGFADFVVAVGTGLTFTLANSPLMAPVAALPLALIPLFGVGISGASHLMAFDMLRRGVGFRASQRA